MQTDTKQSTCNLCVFLDDFFLIEMIRVAVKMLFRYLSDNVQEDIKFEISFEELWIQKQPKNRICYKKYVCVQCGNSMQNQGKSTNIMN